MLFHPDFIESHTAAADYNDNNGSYPNNPSPAGSFTKKTTTFRLPAAIVPIPSATQQIMQPPGAPAGADASYKMFSAVSPSPTRSMIKEANDHLQLLHKRVMELEKTVQDQAEALIRKDELMQVKLRELAESKDGHIGELKRCIENYEQHIKALEQQQRDKDIQLEQLSQKFGNVEDLDSYVPALEKLLVSLKKFPSRHHSGIALPSSSPSNNGGSSSVIANHVGSAAGLVPIRSSGSGRSARKMLRASSTKSLSSADRYQQHHLHANSLQHLDHHYQHSVDMSFDRSIGGGSSSSATPTLLSSGQAVFGTAPSNSGGGGGGLAVGQAMADMRIGRAMADMRSFNINSNFSMSEDEDDEIHSTC